VSSYDNIIQGGASITIGSDLGYLKEGVTMSVASDMVYTRVEGINANVMARNVNQNYEFRTVLAEPTRANLKIAFDWQNASATAAGSLEINTFGGENFIASANDVKIYGYVPGSAAYTRYIELYRAIAIPNGEVSFADAESTGLPITFAGLYYATSSCVGQLADSTA